MLSTLTMLLLSVVAPPARDLDIFFIDADGGAATLIVTPERESILIDSGWPGRDDRDPRRIAHVLKDVAGCDHLDHLVTTHWHTDHFGGVEGLSKLVRIDHFWDRGLPEDGDASLDFPDGPKPDDPLGVAYRKASRGKRKALKAGDALPLKGDVSALVLTSGGKVDREDDTPSARANPLCPQAPPDLPVDPSDNARSLSLIVRLGPFDFLDCGDLTWNVEKRLVCPVDHIRLSDPKHRDAGAVDLFQVTHHGADNSNHPALVRTIEPTVAVMNNGPRKGGAAATVKLLKSIPSIRASYQLHKNAANGPADNTDPASIANADPKGGQFIHVAVAADGSKFTVRIGTDGPSREFTAR